MSMGNERLQSAETRSRRVPRATLRSAAAVAVAVFLTVAVAACAEEPAARNAPIRSPGLDFRSQSPTTSDGRIVGADNKPIEDRLEEQSSTGWAVDTNGKPVYDAKRRVGGHIDTKFDTPPPANPPPK